MGRKSLSISGFPLGTTAGEAKEFLEATAGIGTVLAVKIRSRATVYAIVQFTTREAAEIIRARASDDLRLGLRRLTANPARDIVPRPRAPLFELDGVTLHLGCPLSADRLSVLFSCRHVRLNFSRNLRKIVLFLSWVDRSYKLEFSYESIWEIRRHNSPTQLQDFLVLLVVVAPQIYTLPNQGALFDGPMFNYFKDPDHDERWIRTTDFTETCSVGEASAICLELPLESSLPDISQMFAFYKERRSPLRLEPGVPFSQDLELVPIVRPGEEISLPYETLFKVNHMVQNGTLSGPTLDEVFFRLLDPGRVSQSFVDRALERLSYSKTCCFSPSSWLKEKYEKMGKSKKLGTTSPKISLQPGLVYVHRAQVTPSKVYFFGPEVNVSNHVVRHFKRDLENFMRVSFVDEEGEKLRSVDLQPRQIAGSSDKQTELYRRLQSTLRNGISVGGKRFDFLAFSSSQLKDSSVWMFASRPGLCAADIRRWMGDFSSIRNVAKYTARLGQSFGSSTETLSVARHEIEMIPDVENHEGYIFSDGIGKISAAFAKQVAKKCNLSKTPSAFQIRYGGFKGVVAVDPTARVKLSLRKSMCKFESNNTKLDVLARSKPQVCFLNRQLITLLSTLGVGDEVFLRKQEELVAKLDETLTDPARAMEILSAINPGEMAGILEDMLSCGYVPRDEPFLSMMLQTFRAVKLNELRTKSRIFIPMGRSMMGCMDETSTLEYGQVFVQVSSSSSSSVLDGLETFRESSTNGGGGGSRGIIITGEVVVSKNPCLHPGDLRVLQAVDVPSLHHMVDCVVFPQKGKRPHPNECSGSDLDGDIYFVSWDPELFPPRQVQPMDYTPAPQTSLDRDVTIEDIEEYFVNYLVNDSLGVIANAHTVFADREPDKAMSPHCRELAKLFSIAVDFPKTGVPAVIPPHLAVKEYPDFMEKHDKVPYRSYGVIGKLFRSAKDKDPSSMPLEFTHRQASRCYDPDMEVEGFENYLDEAFFLKGEYDFKLGNLMDLYKIKTEAEILFGGSTKLSKGFNRQRDADAIRLAMKSLKEEVQSWFSPRLRNDNLGDDSLLAKASAWYHVTYHRDYWGCYDEGLDRPHFLSFPWCIHDKLISIKKRKNADRLSAELAAMRIQKQTKKKTQLMWKEKGVVL